MSATTSASGQAILHFQAQLDDAEIKDFKLHQGELIYTSEKVFNNIYNSLIKVNRSPLNISYKGSNLDSLTKPNSQIRKDVAFVSHLFSFPETQTVLEELKDYCHTKASHLDLSETLNALKQFEIHENDLIESLSASKLIVFQCLRALCVPATIIFIDQSLAQLPFKLQSQVMHLFLNKAEEDGTIILTCVSSGRLKTHFIGRHIGVPKT